MSTNHWNAAKAKVQLRLSVQRLRTLQQKKEAQAKASRREIATLVERGKLETARIKVETIINEDVYIELLELLELYCELLLARFGLLDQNAREPDPGIKESVCNIIHAAPRTELKELHVLRDILMHKYGREFSMAVMENRDSCVSDRVVRKLNLVTPSIDLVDGYLAEIAKAYSVDLALAGLSPSQGEASGVTISATESKNKEVDPELVSSSPPRSPPAADDRTTKEDPLKRTQAAEPKETSLSTPPSQRNIAEDDFEVLTKRFAALKKR